MKRLSCNLKISLDVLGVVFCLLIASATGNVFGQETTSQTTESNGVSEKSSTPPEKAHGKRWTVHCEREDGSQGLFRVSSDVTDEASPLDLESNPESKPETGPMVEKPPIPNIEIEPAAAPKDEDPFGSPTLKCGRLLTLLAIFASSELAGH